MFKNMQVQSTGTQQSLQFLARESTGEGWLDRRLRVSAGHQYVFEKNKMHVKNAENSAVF